MKTITAKTSVTLVLCAGTAIAAGAIITQQPDQRADAPTRVNEAPSRKNPAAIDATPASTNSTSESRERAAVTPREDIRGCEFRVGDRASYAIEGEDAASIEPLRFGLKGNASATEVKSSYKGSLNTEVLEVEEGHALLLGELANFRSTAVRQDGKLSRSFLFRVGADCAIQGFAYHSELPAGYARIQQALLHDLSYQIPGATKVGALFEGEDALGKLAGEVRQVEVDGRAMLEKRVDSLEPWSTGMGSLTMVDSHRARITPSKAGWFGEVDMSASYRGTGITSTRSLSASILDAKAPTEGASRSQSDYIWADLLPMSIPLEEGPRLSRGELLARERVAEQPLETMMERMLDRIDTPEAGIHETWPEMRTYLEARPDMVEVVSRKLLADEIPDRATMGVFIALGNTRNIEAKRALEGIVRDAGAPSFDRVRAMFSLVDRVDVGDDFALELAALAAPLTTTEDEAEHLTARHALLALGMMSGRKPHRQEIKQVAIAAIEKALASAPNAVMASPAYGAIMNVGDPELLYLLDGIEDHPDYSTREVAAVVTSRMPPSKTAEFTRRWLSKETDWRVKITLYRAIELQTFAAREMTSREVVELAAADLEQRPGAITRKALVRLLGRATQQLKEDDPLRQRILDEFARMIPFEVEQRTGLYRTIAVFLDPTTLRRALAGDVPVKGGAAQIPMPTPADTPGVVSPTSSPIRSAR